MKKRTYEIKIGVVIEVKKTLLREELKVMQQDHAKAQKETNAVKLKNKRKDKKKRIKLRKKLERQNEKVKIEEQKQKDLSWKLAQANKGIKTKDDRNFFMLNNNINSRGDQGFYNPFKGPQSNFYKAAGNSYYSNPFESQLGGGLKAGAANPFESQFKSDPGNFNEISNYSFIQYNQNPNINPYMQDLYNSNSTFNSNQTINPYMNLPAPNLIQSTPNYSPNMYMNPSQNMQTNKMMMPSNSDFFQAKITGQSTQSSYFDGRNRSNATLHPHFDEDFCLDLNAQLNHSENESNSYQHKQSRDSDDHGHADVYDADENEGVGEYILGEKAWSKLSSDKPSPNQFIEKSALIESPKQKYESSDGEDEEEGDDEDDDDNEEEEEDNDQVPENLITSSIYSSGYVVNPTSGFGIYRNSTLLETHSMAAEGRQSAQFNMSGFKVNRAKSGIDIRNLKHVGSGFQVDTNKVILEMDTEDKSGGGSSMNINDVEGLQGILEELNETVQEDSSNGVRRYQSTNVKLFGGGIEEPQDLDEDSPDEDDLNEAINIANSYRLKSTTNATTQSGLQGQDYKHRLSHILNQGQMN